MTDPEPLWPHPPCRRGGRIKHSVLCPRNDPIVEALRRDAAGRALVVERCSGCGSDDLPERLLDLLDHGGDAA